MQKKIIVVGGVAGGMSCAARLRRLDESMEITVFEKGADVSFANCGMPYYIGGVIKGRDSMLIQTVAGLRNRYGLDVRTRHEVIRIDRAAKQVEVKDLDDGHVFLQSYDKLVLSPGAAPIRPSIPGADGPSVFVLNDLADMEAIATAVPKAKHACVIGAGFIGLELVENFRARGLTVSLVELQDHIMPRMDKEMTQPLVQELRLNGVHLFLEETAVGIEGTGVRLKSGTLIESDFVCMCVGVRPTTRLAEAAGLELGPRGHIRVNAQLQTSDPDIYASGDAVEVVEFVTGQPAGIPLAGPANRQGRIAADRILGRDAAYRGSQGTAIVKVFNLAAAQTGLSEQDVRRLGWPYHRIYVHPMQHPRYYPDAKPVSIKLLFSPDGRILGAQVVGPESVDSIINVLATAQRSGMTVYDLEHLELAYSPQWGGAKHPVNMAGFVACNVLKGDVELLEADNVPSDIYWLDVREPSEAEAGQIPGSTLISVDQLRARHTELPRDKEIGVYCAVGLRGYIAARLLMQKGYRVRNLNGGYRTWCWYQTDRTGKSKEGCCMDTCSQEKKTNTVPAKSTALDVCGLQCPGPIVKVKETIEKMVAGEVLEVTASDPGFAADIPAWCERTGNSLVEVKSEGGNYVARIRKEERAAPAETKAAVTSNSKTIVCFSNDLDRVMATFVIANAAAAMGNAVTIFFTFWGLNVLRKDSPGPVKKGLLDRMFGMMMPRGPQKLMLSKMNMMGMGTRMMKYVMKSKNVASLPELIQSAQNAGVKLVACAMSMDVMGIKREELIDGVEVAGAGYYLGKADEGNVNLFI
ncbi:MAG TPA: DsrE/DsrF/DrsH-like family protein [Candidatus Hydrogenedentes bacterium]|nr:DsrE/DsrF/DrsH-like family protein [Candidatus Hydrogenedentota bacterium]